MHASSGHSGIVVAGCSRERTPAADGWRHQRLHRATGTGLRFSAPCIYRAAAWPRTRSGLPDLGISTMDDVLTDIRRITDAVPLPLLVDADTGWGGAFNIARTVRSFIKFGAAGLHIEDQVQAKRCGHRPGKEIVLASRNGRSHQGGGRCAHGSELRHHGAHRRAGGRRPGAGDRARAWPVSRPAPTWSFPRR